MALSPIAIFVYKRTDTLQAMLDSLEACPEFISSPVFIYSDGPKSPQAQIEIDAVRAFVKARLRPNMTLIEAPANKGLAKSIIGSVTELCERFGRVIVIEDDLVLSPASLAFFNRALEKYSDDPSVFQISAHSWDPARLAERRKAYFLPMIGSWGWATWKRAWDKFDPGVTDVGTLDHDRTERKRFDLDGRYPYYRMMQRQLAGKIDSWAIRWYWTLFRHGGVALYPPRTMVANLGTDPKATHRGIAGTIKAAISRPSAPRLASEMPVLPEKIEVEPDVFQAVKREIYARTSKLSPRYWMEG